MKPFDDVGSYVCNDELMRFSIPGDIVECLSLSRWLDRFDMLRAFYLVPTTVFNFYTG